MSPLSPRLLGVPAVAAALTALSPAVPSALAAEEGGFTVRAALQRSLATVDYHKIVGVAATTNVDNDRARGPVDALEASFDYRFFAAPDFYVATELGGVLHFGDTSGFLRGTGDGDADVWPGAWSVEKRYTLNLTAKLGYAPPSPGWLGEGGSFYLFAGVGRLRLDMDTRHLNPRRGIASGRSASDTVTPWRVGAGVEIGAPGGRVDLRVAHTGWEAAFGRGSGTAADPTLDYAFEAREWGFSIGYVIPIGD